MKCVLILLSVCFFSCSVRRDIDSSVRLRSEENLQLDVADIRTMGGVLERNRLYLGGYQLRGKWKIYDTSAPQLPDGSFPLLAEGSTEEQGTVEENENSREEIFRRDSTGVSAVASVVKTEDQTDSERMKGSTGINWLNALIWGVCIGIVLIGLLWWKYGEKN